MNPFEYCEIYLDIRTPEGKRFGCNVTIDRDIYQRSLAKLPVNREIPWEYRDQERAIQQIELRRHIVRYVSENLAEQLMKLVEKQDTKNGYPQ